jgi:hypothetical protein
MDCDIPGFYTAGTAFIENGQIVRGDYPFLASFYFAAPAMLSSNLREYEIWFGLQNVLLWLACLVLMCQLALDFGKTLMPVTWPLLATTAPMMGWLIIARYDVLPVFLGLLGLYLWRHNRTTISMLVLVLGFWVKFFTALMIPPLLLALLAQRRLWALAGSLAAISASVASPFLWLAPNKLLQPFIFQGNRSLTGESLLYQLYYALDFTEKTNGRPWEGVQVNIHVFANEYLSAFLIAIMLSWYFYSAVRLWRCKRNDLRIQEEATGLAAGAVLVFLLFNRMYSEQFIIWIWGLVPLIYFSRPPSKKPFWGTSLLATLFVASIFNPAHFALASYVGTAQVLCRTLFWVALLWTGWIALDIGQTVQAPRVRKPAIYLCGFGLLFAVVHWMNISIWAWAVAGCLLIAAALIVWRSGTQRAVVVFLLVGSLTWSVWNLAQPNMWVEHSEAKANIGTEMWGYCCRYDSFPPGIVTARAFMKPEPSYEGDKLLTVQLTTERGKRVVASKEAPLRPGGQWVEISTGVLRQASEIEFRARVKGVRSPPVTRLQLLWQANGLTLLEIVEIWSIRGASNWLVFLIGTVIFSLGLSWLEVLQRQRDWTGMKAPPVKGLPVRTRSCF